MEGKFLSFPCCFLREKVPLKAPPAQNDRNVQTEPSREPLGSLGHPRSGPSWLPVLRLTSAPCFSGFTGRWSFPPFREVISRVPNLDPGSSALSAFGAATVPHAARRRLQGAAIGENIADAMNEVNSESNYLCKCYVHGRKKSPRAAGCLG